MAFVVSQCGSPSRLHLSITTSATVKIATCLQACVSACCMRKRLLDRLGLHERPRVRQRTGSLMCLLDLHSEERNFDPDYSVSSHSFQSQSAWMTGFIPGHDLRWKHSSERPHVEDYSVTDISHNWLCL